MWKNKKCPSRSRPQGPAYYQPQPVGLRGGRLQDLSAARRTGPPQHRAHRQRAEPRPRQPPQPQRVVVGQRGLRRLSVDLQAGHTGVPHVPILDAPLPLLDRHTCATATEPVGVPLDAPQCSKKRPRRLTDASFGRDAWDGALRGVFDLDGDRRDIGAGSSTGPDPECAATCSIGHFLDRVVACVDIVLRGVVPGLLIPAFLGRDRRSRSSPGAGPRQHPHEPGECQECNALHFSANSWAAFWGCAAARM